MILVAAILAAFSPTGEAIVLLEEATVEGRYVRLADVVRADGLDAPLRDLLRAVYLGRAPEEGLTRTVTAREIRRQIVLRGFDPETVPVVGEKVRVTRGLADERTAGTRAAIEKRIVNLVDGPAGDATVRITAVVRGELPAEGGVVRVTPVGRHGASLREFLVTFRDGTARVRARIRRARTAVYAVRDIAAHRTIKREDVEVRRVGEEADSDVVGNVDALVGGRATVRIHRGSAIRAGQVRAKPAVRAGDVVRVHGPGFETDARAVSDASVGQALQLEYLATRNRFRGVVVDAGTVRVKEDGK